MYGYHIITPNAHRECVNFKRPTDRSSLAREYLFHVTANARHAVATNARNFDFGGIPFEVSRETENDYSVRHDGVCIFVLHRGTDGQLKVVK